MDLDIEILRKGAKCRCGSDNLKTNKELIKLECVECGRSYPNYKSK